MTHDAIEKLAYQLWEEDQGKQSPEHYWFEAEKFFQLTPEERARIAEVLDAVSWITAELINYNAFPVMQIPETTPTNWQNEGF